MHKVFKVVWEEFHCGIILNASCVSYVFIWFYIATKIQLKYLISFSRKWQQWECSCSCQREFVGLSGEQTLWEYSSYKRGKRDSVTLVASLLFAFIFTLNFRGGGVFRSHFHLPPDPFHRCAYARPQHKHTHTQLFADSFARRWKCDRESEKETIWWSHRVFYVIQQCWE